MITIRRAKRAAIKHATRLSIQLRTALGAATERECNACHTRVAQFFRYGDESDWGCPACGASPRERFVNAALDNRLLSIPRGGRILHVAPSERSLVGRFRDVGVLITGDLYPDKYRYAKAVSLDLMNFDELGDFDLIYASHVMEHVPQDAIVLSNMYARLRPGGQVWLLVPMVDSPTIDGAPGLSVTERERLFGQWDHVRQYGPDFAERIAGAGFAVDTVTTADFRYPIRQTYGLSAAETIFRGVKSF